MKRHCLYLSLSIFTSISVLLPKDNVNGFDNQYMHAEETLPDMFFAPIACTRSSISYFLEHTYNHPLYGPEFLAFNLFHVEQFLNHARFTKQPRRYTAQALSPFTRKIQSLYIIHYTAFFEILEQLPAILKPLFDKNKEKQKIVEALMSSTYDFLVHDFKKLRTDPDSVLRAFAEKQYSITTAESNSQQDCSIEQLQEVLVQFLTAVSSKLIWHEIDQEKTWQVLKAISYVFKELNTLRIITEKHCDDFVWILLFRYAEFLESKGGKLDRKSVV
jgi:hypothetical protein